MEVRALLAQMQEDASSIGIEIAEMNSGDFCKVREQMHHRRRIPSRHVRQEPALESGKISPGAKVLDEQDSAERAFERKPLSKGALRNSRFSKHTGDRAQIGDSCSRPCDEA